jgi:hypothetical protein
MDSGDPVPSTVYFTVNSVVVDPCMYWTHTNSLYVLPIGVLLLLLS